MQPRVKKQDFDYYTGVCCIMDEPSDDDYMVSSRDRSAFMSAIMMAENKAEVVSILQLFETTEKYFIDNFPDLAKAVTDLPDSPPASE